MANEVIINIPGIGDVVAENAASEATLRDILSAIKANGGTGGGAGGGNAGGGSSSAAQTESAEKSRIDKIKKFAESVDKLGVKVVNSIDTFARLNGSVSSAAGAVGDLAKNIPMFGKTLEAAFNSVAAAQTNLIGSFQQASTSGAAFAGSLNVFVANASAASMTLQEYGQFVASNGEALRALGGNTEEGARRFGILSKALRDSSSDLYSLGFSTKELNDGLAKYSVNQQYLGNLGKKSNTDLIAGTKAYLKELDILAKITGESREQKAAELNGFNVDVQFRAFIDSLGERGETAGAALQSALGSVGPTMNGFIKDMVTAGVPTTEQNQMMFHAFSQTASQAADFGRALKDSNVSQEQLEKMKQKMLETASAEAKAYKQGEGAIQVFGAGLDSLTTASGEMAKYDANARKAAIDAQDPVIQKTNELINAYSIFQTKITEVGNTFTNVLAKSGVFDTLIKMFNLQAGVIERISVPMFNAFGATLKTTTDQLSEWITPFLNSLSGLAEYIPSILSGAFGPLGEYLKSQFGGIFDEITGITDKATFDPKEISKKITEWLGTALNEGFIGLKKFWYTIEEVGIRVALLANSFDTIRETFLKLQIAFDNLLQMKIFGQNIFGDEVATQALIDKRVHEQQLRDETASLEATKTAREKHEAALMQSLSDVTDKYKSLDSELAKLNTGVKTNAENLKATTAAPYEQATEEKAITGKAEEAKAGLPEAKSASETRKIFEQELIKSGITDAKALASYMGIAEGETGGFTQLKEAGKYKADRIRSVFSPRPDIVARADEIAAMGKEQQYNALYGGEWGKKNLGNIAADDGYKYRGRGFNQLTGRSNYQKIGQMIGADLVNNPDLLMDPKIAAQANIAYNKSRLGSLGTKATFEDYLKATGGSHELWPMKRAAYAKNLEKYQAGIPSIQSEPVLAASKPITPIQSELATPKSPAIKPISTTAFNSMATDKQSQREEDRQNKLEADKIQADYDKEEASKKAFTDSLTSASPLEDKLQVFDQILQELRSSNQMTAELLSTNERQVSIAQAQSGNVYAH